MGNRDGPDWMAAVGITLVMASAIVMAVAIYMLVTIG